MAVNLSPIGGAGAQFFDNNGVPLSGGKLYSYQAGTTTPQTTYTTVDGNVAHTNPIILDSAGRVPGGEIWVTPNKTLKFVLKTADEVLLGTYDNVYGINVISQFIDVQQYGAVGNGVTDDTVAIQNAVTACFASGQQLYFSAGTYLTTASIVNFHDVVKFGPGVIKRGSNFFHIQIKASQSNVIYVATTGSDSNDGLSSSQPLLTVQAAFNALYNYGPVLNGTWTVKLAAGSYTAASTLIGLRSKNNIVIQGPSVGGHPNVPTAIIDGNGLTSNTGMYLQFHVSATIKDVKFQNWSYSGNGFGLAADGHCQIYLDNAHFYNCYYAGVSCDNLTQVRMQGGIVDGCTYYGVRLYSQVSASIGYSGSGVGSSTIIQNCGAGIYGAVSSRIHVDYCDINNNDVGLFTDKNSRSVANYTKFDTNGYAVRTELESVYGESGGGTNTFTSNGKDYVCASSSDDVSIYQVQWDRAANTWLYGANSYQTNTVKFKWQIDGVSSGASYNSGAKAVFDFNGGTNNWVGISAPATANAGILWSTVAKANQGAVEYRFSSDRMYFWVGGTAKYLMTTSALEPVVDNSNSLGTGSFRWSTVYAATGTINTSDANQKQQIRSISNAERAVAVKLKSLIRAFKFNDAVNKKGTAARIHFGVIAQDVKTAFESEGLVAENYGVFCSDTLSNGTQRLGVRYEELFAFIIGAM